ncbi:MAG TPA: sulfite exporter TauE/SafE family protein [Bacillota bacterium]
MLIFVIVGFFAQLIDGALGMAYGVSSTTFLLYAGVPTVIASASVHMAEVFTTLVSGISHLSFNNIDRKLLQKLLIPGVLGGIVGAYLLTNISTKVIKPFINGYLVIMGIIIVVKVFKTSNSQVFSNSKAWLLGLTGGFFDAIGGGGWGPIVTSSLVAAGQPPRFVVGTVNVAEFFVTVAQVTTFVTILGLKQHWKAVAGLALGGMLAAPLAAFGCKKIAPRVLMFLVGALIIFLNIKSLITFFLN